MNETIPGMFCRKCMAPLVRTETGAGCPTPGCGAARVGPADVEVKGNKVTIRAKGSRKEQS